VLYHHFDEQVRTHRSLRFTSYTRDVPCAICNIRKQRRSCPSVHGEICTICCATEREQTLDCPLDCQYLREAHEHEKPPDLDIASVPNQDIEVTEEFLEANQIPMAFIAVALFEGAMQSNGATDWDVREALQSSITSYRALQSGIYYETRPVNVYAAAIVDHLSTQIAAVKEEESKAGQSSSLPDSAILAILAFFQRLEYSRNNGRKRGRAFLDLLSGFYQPTGDTGESLIESDPEPRIIL
jgi:hypothetical protein